MATRLQSRGTLSALISAALHAVALLVFAATSIRIVNEDRDLIPLVIRQPAPPPPPPGGGNGTAIAAARPAAQPVPVQPVQPARPVKPIEPKPIERPKIAAKPRPKAKPVPQPERELARPQPTPALASAPANEGAGAAAAGGVVGGVAGGQPGGVVGGRLGGTGDSVWQADQVAVPPKPIERILPSYPAVARARGQEGVVVVRAVIDRRGSVEPEGLRVVESKPPFDDAALSAVRKWKFQPGRDDNGQVVRVLVDLPIRFRLQ